MDARADRLVSERVITEIQRGRIQPWTYTALRTKSAALRDIMALALTDGAMGERALRDHLTAGSALGDRVASLRPTAVALATVWTASAGDDSARVAAHRLFRHVVTQEPELLTRDQQQIYAQLSFTVGEDTHVREALEMFPSIPLDVAESLRADLLNPSRRGAGSFDEWVRHLAAPFVRDGLAPITVDLNAPTLFDGLQAAAPPPVTDGPLVTVIMPCFRPDGALLSSVRSIAAQSYENLEILLVDDASGPEFGDLFDQAAAIDPRLRYVELTPNGGTYRARNTALELARGTYVTVQDADDWSHPERIADQVRALVDNPDASASISDAIRAMDDLTHQWIGYSPRRRNASSLMFRLADVARTGPFDLVRKSGDSEFYERLKRLIGPVVDTRTPLAITRLQFGSLSRSDFSFQWMDPDRLLYRAAFRSWHRTLSPDLPPFSRDADRGHRPFPAPRAMLRGLPGERARQSYDIVVILDGSDPVAAQEALDLCPRQDLSLAALHLEDATRGRQNRPEIDEMLLAAQREGLLDIVGPHDVESSRLVVIATTGTLELPQTPEPRVRTDNVAAVVRPATGLRSVQDLAVVSDTCLELFGRRPQWTAATEADRATWAVDGWELPLTSQVVEEARNAYPQRGEASRI